MCSTSAMPTMSLERRYAMLLKKDGHDDQEGGGPITREPWITCRAEHSKAWYNIRRDARSVKYEK